MGDRATVTVVESTKASAALGIYAHWAGHRIKQSVAKAIRYAKNAGRDSDYSYFSRILFCNILIDPLHEAERPDSAREEALRGTSSFGIEGVLAKDAMRFGSMLGSEYPHIHICVEDATVTVEHDETYTFDTFMERFIDGDD